MPRNGLRTTRRALLRGGVACSLGLAGCIANSGPESSPGASPDSNSDAPAGDAVRWAVDVGGSVRHRPTVRDGVVYVAGGTNDRAAAPGDSFEPSSAENVFALSTTDGSERWRYEAPAGVTSRPVVRDGIYAVVGWAGPMASGSEQRLVRVADGERTWASEPANRNRSLLAVGDDAAYLGTSDDAIGVYGERLTAIATDDGSERWSVETGDALGATLQGGVLYLEEGISRTTARDVADGSANWLWDGPAVEEPRVSGDALFVEGSEGDDVSSPVVALDASDGSERWRFSAPVDDPFVPTGAVVADGVAFVTEYDGWLFALDADDGTEQWRYSVDGDTSQPPAVAEGTVYLTTPGAVYGVDAETGDRRWVEQRASRPWIAAASADGVVVTGDGEETGAYVRAYAPDGTERWTFATDRDLTRPAVSGSRAVVGTEDGFVVALGAE